MNLDYRDAPSGEIPAAGTSVSLDAAAAGADGFDEAAELVATDEVESRSGAVPAALHGQRLDKVLVSLAPEFSRSHLQQLIEAGHVRVDGQPAASASRKLKAGQQVQVLLVPTQETQAFRAEPVPLGIVHEDESLLVLNKAAGVVVHPAAGNWSGTLLNGLLAHHAAAAQLPRAGIVHRLDKDTSGLMVVGKTLPAVTALSRAIAAREVKRQYLAITHGVPDAAMRIELPIGRDPQSRVKMAVVGIGKAARTDVLRLVSQDKFSGVRCSLHTGRTHQIRVHLAARGFPLLADTVYGGRVGQGLQRQALHAARLAFVHPISGRLLDFQAPLPADMAETWRGLFGSLLSARVD